MDAQIREAIVTLWHVMDIATVTRMQLYGNARLPVPSVVVSNFKRVQPFQIQFIMLSIKASAYFNFEIKIGRLSGTLHLCGGVTVHHRVQTPLSRAHKRTSLVLPMTV